MLIKPQYDTYRYTSELCKIQSQSIVECRLPSGEISSVVTVYARAVPEETSCLDGEVKYSGKLYLTVVYKDLDGKICRAERGAEFFHKAQDERITPACFAKTVFETDGVKTRREGSGFYISVVVSAKIALYGSAQMEYLVGGDGLVVKKSTAEVVKTVCVSGETEEEDAFETDGIADVLLHSECANIAQAYLSSGKVTVIGEILSSLCLLKGEKVVAYERQIPFTVELPVDEWMEKSPVRAKTEIKSAQITVTTDEEKNKSKASVSLVLYTECLLYKKEEVGVCDDVFSPACNLLVKKEKVGGRYLTNAQRFSERVGGTASMSVAFDGEFTLQSVIRSKVEITCKRVATGFEAEGYIEAETAIECAEGIKNAVVTLPFVFPMQADDGELELDAVVYGLSVRRNGELIEADATLKVTANEYQSQDYEYVNGVEEGEKYPETTSAISIYIPTEGDGLWEIAKKLKRTPEDVQKSNPTLEFPVKKGERLFIYRQLCE